MSVLEPRLTSNAGLRISIFSNPSYSYMCMYSGDKFQFALSHETKFHIQKCNNCRNIEIQSSRIKFCNGTVHRYQYSAILNLVLSKVQEFHSYNIQKRVARKWHLLHAYYCNFVNFYFQHPILRADCRESRDATL